MATREQIEANRQNAKKSTGPKSPSGKAATKLNGLKHGLRSEQLVLPTEDPAEFRAFVDAWVADWRPPTMARLQLVEDAAAAAWRKRRCLRVEAARLGGRVRDARIEWGRARSSAADRLMDRLTDLEDDEPREAVAALLATREGVDRLIERWQLVVDRAAPGDWDEDMHFLFIRLQGHCAGDDEVREVRDASWALFLVDAPEDMRDDDDPEPLTARRAKAVREAIRAEATGRIAALRSIRETHPDESAARDAHAELAAFAPRPEDAPLQRYEAQLSREFHRALADLVKLTKSGDDLAETPEEEAGEADAPSEAKSAEVASAQEVNDGFSGTSAADDAGSDDVEAFETPSDVVEGPIRRDAVASRGADPGSDRS